MEYRWMIEESTKASTREILFRLDGVCVSTEAFAQWIRNLKAEVQHNYEVAQQAMKDRQAAILQNDELLDVIDRLRHFIGDTFYANVPSDEKPLPNSWYKGMSYTYGQVLDGIMKDVPTKTEKPRGVVITHNAAGEACCADCGEKDYPLSNHTCKTEKRNDEVPPKPEPRGRVKFDEGDV